MISHPDMPPNNITDFRASILEIERCDAVYKFSELTDSAKEVARNWYREGLEFDGESVTDYAQESLKIMGFNVKVYWSGFGSQSDGCSISGTWYQSSISETEVPEHPGFEAIHASIKKLVELNPDASAVMTTNRYNQTSTDARDFESDPDDFCELVRDICNLIFSDLQADYEYQNSDEAVDESILCNEYEFTEEGKLA